MVFPNKLRLLGSMVVLILSALTVHGNEPPISTLPAALNLPMDGSITLDLEDYVSDPDTPIGELTWEVIYVLGGLEVVLSGSELMIEILSMTIRRWALARSMPPLNAWPSALSIPNSRNAT